jgi:hypothetical protein
MWLCNLEAWARVNSNKLSSIAARKRRQRYVKVRM